MCIIIYVINFVFSFGKQLYRETINFVSYIMIYTTHIYMRTNYLRHLANIIGIQWRRPVVGGGGGGWAQLPIEWVNLL